MNWKTEAINDLKKYSQRKAAIENLNRRIAALEERFVSLRGMPDGERVMGGAPKGDEVWLDNICEREKLAFSLKTVEILTELTERGLSSLDERERRVLEGFYIDDMQNHTERLCRELNMEKSTLYRLKDAALERFTRSEYGIVEL